MAARAGLLPQSAEVDDAPRRRRRGPRRQRLGALAGRLGISPPPSPSSGPGSRRCELPRAPAPSDAGSSTSPAHDLGRRTDHAREDTPAAAPCSGAAAALPTSSARTQPPSDVAGGAGDEDHPFSVAHSASPNSRSLARSSGSESSTIAPRSSSGSLRWLAAAAANQQRRPFGQSRRSRLQCCQQAFVVGGVDDAERDGSRARVPGGRQQVGHRQVGTEIGNPPSLRRRARRHHERADLVHLARRSRHHQPRRLALHPVHPDQPLQNPPEHRRAHVLLSHRHRSATHLRPPASTAGATTSSRNRGPPSVTAARWSTACSSSASSARTARSASATNSAAAELSTAPSRGIAGAGGASASRRSSVRQGKGGDAGDAVAPGRQLPELAEPLDVLVGIEPLSARIGGEQRPHNATPRPGGRGETGRCGWPPAGPDVGACRSCCL